jgi:hypothetical protein
MWRYVYQLGFEITSTFLNHCQLKLRKVKLDLKKAELPTYNFIDGACNKICNALKTVEVYIKFDKLC